MGREVVIVSAVRTAVGTFGGSLRGLKIRDLGGLVIKEAVNRAGIDPVLLDEVILGNVNSPATCLNVGKDAALKAGLPVSVPGFTLNRLCGSSLQAINVGSMMIMSGQADAVLAGGVENMSDYPYAVFGTRWGTRFGNAIMIDEAAATLSDEESGMLAGGAAELLQEKYNISREEQDEFSYESQMKAKKAIESGTFKEEILPVMTVKGSIFEVDEHPKLNATMEKLAKLPPVFKAGGTVTAGNSCGMNDGASALVLMSSERARELGIKPMVRIVSFATGSLAPEYFGEAPVLGIKKAMSRAGIGISQIDLIECNEAFAVQTLAVEKQLGWDHNRLNVNGGAIALGHALGSTGGRLMTTLVYELLRRQGRYGLATACTGGGMGVATIVERI